MDTICQCIQYTNPNPQSFYYKEAELCVRQINNIQTTSPATYLVPNTITVEGLPKNYIPNVGTKLFFDLIFGTAHATIILLLYKNFSVTTYI